MLQELPTIGLFRRNIGLGSCGRVSREAYAAKDIPVKYSGYQEDLKMQL